MEHAIEQDRVQVYNEKRTEGVAAMKSDPGHTLERAALDLLGGAEVFGAAETLMDVHVTLQAGLPASVWARLRSHLHLIAGEPELIELIGREPRPHRRLSRTRSNRVWTFARLLARATDVLGGSVAAEDWLVRPAMALDRRRPIDLLKTSVGAQMVDDHLTRMDFSVSA